MSPFEKRLRALNIKSPIPTFEIDAAIRVYERLVTAEAICASLEASAGHSDVLAAVFSALSAEVQAGQGPE